MTNEEAKNIIIKERDSLKDNPIVKVEDCLYEAFDMAIKALEQTRWIPVSERLPKEKGNYLVCYNDGYISVSEWHPNPYEKVCFDLFPSLIVAWMPIMPYTAESEVQE